MSSPSITSSLRPLRFAALLPIAACLALGCGDSTASSDGTETDGEDSTGDGGPGPGTLPPSTMSDPTMASATDDTGTGTGPGPDTDPPADGTATETGDPLPECGNGVAERGEVCDGDDVAGATCRGEGFGGGRIACAADCSELDTSACTPVCENFGFDPDPTIYAVPGTDYAGDGDFSSLAGTGNCNAGLQDWATTDLDGDGFLDLVVTDDAVCTGVSVSESHWLVHLGDAGGFAAVPIEWALPGADYAGDGDFETLSGAGSCQNGLVDWATLDLDGDGNQDLVITDDSLCTMQVIGEEHWLVYAGDGSGFAATPTEWALPGAAYPFDGDFFQPSFEGNCGQALVGWATLDIDGDGFVDLVVTNDAECVAGPIGEAYWLVHPGGAGGFDPVAVEFAIPGADYPADGDFDGLGGTGDCNAGEVDWATLDISGDGFVDLVITDDAACTGGTVGESEWRVYLGDGTGFAATAVSWALPGADYVADGDFDALAGAGDCNAGEVDWATVDIDHDGFVDLVITDDAACVGGPIGETEWLVYPGDGTGFAATPTSWALPGAAYTPDGDFTALAGAGDCNQERVDWATVDLGNDGFLDLVVTDDPACTGGPIGETEWHVHTGCTAP